MSGTEGVGFEPTMPFEHAGFQDRSHKPLDHPSKGLPNGLYSILQGKLYKWFSCEPSRKQDVEIHSDMRG